MKRKLVIIFLIFVLLVCFFACTKNNEEKQKVILGTWWWSDSLSDEYLNFAAQNNVTEIYYCSSKFNDKTNEFIKKAKNKNIDVYWLAGEHEWIDDKSSLIKQIEKYIAYQDKYEYKFSGIHLDIEPQQKDDWHENRAELLYKYVQLTYDLKLAYPNIFIEYDIQMSWEEDVEFRGTTKPVYAHVIDNASRVTIMSYRDSAEKIYKVSESEINYAKSVNKKLNVSVACKSSEGDQVSFMEEGKNVMYEEISKLRKMIPSDFGVVIHQIKQWYELKD